MECFYQSLSPKDLDNIAEEPTERMQTPEAVEECTI